MYFSVVFRLSVSMVLLMTTIWWSGDWSGKRGGSSRNGNFVPQCLLSCPRRLTDLPLILLLLLCHGTVQRTDSRESKTADSELSPVTVQSSPVQSSTRIRDLVHPRVR